MSTANPDPLQPADKEPNAETPPITSITEMPRTVTPKFLRAEASAIAKDRKAFKDSLAGEQKRYIPDSRDGLCRTMKRLNDLRSQIEEEQKTVALWHMGRHMGSPQLSLSQTADVTGLSIPALSRLKVKNKANEGNELELPKLVRQKPVRKAA